MKIVHVKPGQKILLTNAAGAVVLKKGIEVVRLPSGSYQLTVGNQEGGINADS